MPGLSSPGLGGLASPGLGALGGGSRWHQDIDPEVWFEDGGDQPGSIQELFGQEGGSIFRGEGAGAGAAPLGAAGGAERGGGGVVVG